VNADALKLTTYFGEHDRNGGRFLADALLDAYERHELRTSVLLRGAEGFGLKHHLRTDRLLTLSEDLPLVSVAVDTRERIERVLPEVTAMHATGLVTLERARLLTGTTQLAHEQVKLTVYVGRQARVDGRPAFAAVTDLLHRHGLAGATVLLGVDGTAAGVRRRARFFARNADVPMMVIAVGDAERIGRVLPELGGYLLTAERVRVLKRDGRLLARPDEHAAPGMLTKLTVYGAHQHLVPGLRRAGVSGATALRGIWGFHGDHAPHGDRLLQLRRNVPLVTIVIDEPERIAAAFPTVDELTRERGLVTAELVPVRRYGSAS
jgi:PII-like signaling protein